MTDIAPLTIHETLSTWLQADGMPILCDLKKSQGSYLHDVRSGKDYLDMSSFYGGRPLGFNHPKLLDPTFVLRLEKIALKQPQHGDVDATEYASFVQTLGTVALGNDFSQVFVMEGGSLALEHALKTAIDWKHHNNKKGSHIIAFKEAFHGSTAHVLSHVTNPKKHFPFDEKALAETMALEHVALTEIDEIFNLHPHEVAAIIIEPIQCAGGDNYFRSEFFQKLRAIANERECLLIFDEVQTGFGATGHWWAWQWLDVKPDIMLFGKKAGVCGFAASQRLDEAGSTFSNVADMVRCERVMQIVLEEKLLDNATTMGRYLQKLLLELSHTRSDVSNVRGIGVLAAFDMTTTAVRDQLLKACFEQELIVLPCGLKSICMRPTLDVNADAVGRAVAQLEAALRQTTTKRCS